MDLVSLTLRNIPYSGYISPEVIVTSLAMLANLKFLAIGFESSLSLLNQEHEHPPPLTLTVLPVLTHFEVQGVSKYVEDLVSRIDAPLLDSICITFLHQFIFDTSRLAQFLRRTTRFQALNEAHVYFDFYSVLVESFPPTQTVDEKSRLRISREDIDWDISSMTQVLTSLFPSICIVEHLYLYGYLLSPSKPEWGDHNEDVQWLEIFRPFTAVKSLYVCEEFAQHIAPALQELGERAADVLPAMESLFLEELQASDPLHEAFGQFVDIRQLLGHPVAVSHWDRI